MYGFVTYGFGTCYDLLCQKLFGDQQKYLPQLNKPQSKDCFMVSVKSVRSKMYKNLNSSV